MPRHPDTPSPTDSRSTAAWQALDTAHHLHPFTDHHSLGRKGSRIITRAEGIYLWDSDGNRLLDGMAGLWCVNLGYGREELVRAAAGQMRELAYYNNFFQSTHPPAVELAATLAELTPAGLEHVFFTSSGSEAIDTTVRMARQYWTLQGQPERQIIISRRNAYHGSTVAAAALGGMAPMWAQGGVAMPGVEHVEQPFWYALGGRLDREEFGIRAAGWLESRIEALGPERVAAFIAEPIQGAGGVIVPPASYWPEVRRICERFDILLMIDEVICGFGRTGRWFASEHYDLEPDLMPIAKGLSSGYLPIGGVMLSNRVARVLIDQGGEFHHGFTYSGHPTCAAVALENIRILREEHVVDRVGDDVGPYFQRALRTLLDHPLVGEIRGVGLMAGIQLCADKARRTAFANEGQVGTACREHSLDCGLVMRAVGDAMILSPPLVITHEQVDELIARARDALDRTARDLPGR
jgi:putrescine aminotransferase